MATLEILIFLQSSQVGVVSHTKITQVVKHIVFI